jgi:two-component system, sensor histidine kinase and response regulator
MGVCERSVLVVEDDDDIRESVAEVLKDDGFRVTTARNGSEAIESLRTHEPCVVLVDLMMPVMTGWELVSRMRADDSLARVPVVVTSAASERSPPGVDRVLAKPIDLDALIRAVHDFCRTSTADVGPLTSLAIRELARRNVELAELQRFRDEMSALIVHDLKNPMGVIIANLDYVMLPDAEESEKILAIQDARTASTRVMRLIGNLLDLTRLETGRFLPERAPVQIAQLLSGLTARRGHTAFQRTITLTTALDSTASIEADADAMLRVFENIIDNSFRYTPPAGRIHVALTQGADHLRVFIGNSGRAIPDDDKDKIFDKFGQLGPESRMNLGLGLYFCRLVIEAHGGTIRVEPAPDYPAGFVVELPL